MVETPAGGGARETKDSAATATTVVERGVTLINKYGLHARPATLLAETANRFKSEITILKDDQEVNGKSIFGIMMLAAEKGSLLQIRAVGADAAEAVDSLEALINKKFNEE
jgi:phosphocarrier protein